MPKIVRQKTEWDFRELAMFKGIVSPRPLRSLKKTWSDEAREAAAEANRAKAAGARWGEKNLGGEKRFITSMGGDRSIQYAEGSHKVTDEKGEVLKELPKHAVWGERGKGKPEVLETHNDLARMMREHDVPAERTYQMGSGRR
jgi:hypothetical protein